MRWSAEAPFKAGVGSAASSAAGVPLAFPCGQRRTAVYTVGGCS